MLTLLAADHTLNNTVQRVMGNVLKPEQKCTGILGHPLGCGWGEYGGNCFFMMV